MTTEKAQLDRSQIVETVTVVEIGKVQGAGVIRKGKFKRGSRFVLEVTLFDYADHVETEYVVPMGDEPRNAMMTTVSWLNAQRGLGWREEGGGLPCTWHFVHQRAGYRLRAQLSPAVIDGAELEWLTDEEAAVLIEYVLRKKV